MKPQAFQLGELRDEHDQIIRAGAYGKKTPFVSADNNAILDYIMNNFDALYAQIPNGRAYVKSVNNITPDSNGNVTINLGGGGGTGGTNITVDSTLSSASTNPVQNKVIYAALNNKLDKNGVATYAACDGSGNIISSTYARKTELSGYVKSINNVKPDSAGNVNISTGGTNVTPDLTPYMKKTADSDLMMGVHKLIFGKTIISDDYRNTVPMFTIDATGGRGVNIKGPDVLVNGICIATETDLSDKLDKTGTADKATRDGAGNVITETYATKADVSGVVKSVNGTKPDSNGDVSITVSGGSNVTVDTALSATSTNPIANKTVYSALGGKLGKTETAYAATKATQDGAGNVIATTYIKTVNNLKPDASGNVNISGGTNITVDTVLSVNSANAIANKAVYNALRGKLGVADTAEYAKRDSAGNVIVDTYANKADISGVVKSVNGTTPDSNGNVNISAGGGDGVSTSVANTWTAQQNFQRLKFNFESFATSRISGTYDSPATSVATYNVTGALKLDMSTLVGMINNGDTSIFTAYIASNGSYALSITNAGTLKYAGSAADLAITASGLLLNIFLTKNPSGVVTSIAQATKLS